MSVVICKRVGCLQNILLKGEPINKSPGAIGIKLPKFSSFQTATITISQKGGSTVRESTSHSCFWVMSTVIHPAFGLKLLDYLLLRYLVYCS